MNKIPLIVLLILAGCSNGKIDLKSGRSSCNATSNSQNAVLVNKSSDKKITFTIKKMDTEKPDEYSFRTYTLFPGEEQSIGCTDEVNYINSSVYLTDTTHYEFQIVGEFVETK